MALATTLAMPNLERLSAGVTRTTERDRILDQFTGLGRRAMLQGRSYVVFGTGDAPDADPPGTTRDPGAAAGAESHGGPPGRSSDPLPHADRERYVVDLPEGWEIRIDPPLVVRANGVCLGAELTLHHRGAADVRVDLEPPYCRIEADGT